MGWTPLPSGWLDTTNSTTSSPGGLRGRVRFDLEDQLLGVGIPAAAVRRPAERIDGDIATARRGLWPVVDHPAMGAVRVDGQPVTFSETDWSIERAGPVLGQHNRDVYRRVLGLSDGEIDRLIADGVI